jgi:hypothetical protein
MLKRISSIFWPDTTALLCPKCREYADVRMRRRYFRKLSPHAEITCNVCNVSSAHASWKTEGLQEELRLSSKIKAYSVELPFRDYNENLETLIEMEAQFVKLKTGE